MLPEQVEKLNRQNTEHSQEKSDADGLRQDDRGRQESAELILHRSDSSAVQPGDRKQVTREGEEEEEEEDGNLFEDSESEEEKQCKKVEDDEKRKHKEKAESSNSESVAADSSLACLQPQQRYSQCNSYLQILSLHVTSRQSHP